MRSVRVFGARLLLVLTAVALVLAGCSGSGNQAPAVSSDQPVVAGEPAGFNADDISFAQDMIFSKQQSIELAKLVPERSTDPDLVAQAAGFGAAQTSDLQLLKVFVVQWSASQGDGTVQDGHAGTAAGLVDEATVARLRTSSGQEFDTLWLQTVIGTVQREVARAQTEVAKGANVDAVATAKRMVDSQQAQVGQLRRLLPTG